MCVCVCVWGGGDGGGGSWDITQSVYNYCVASLDLIHDLVGLFLNLASVAHWFKCLSESLLV